MRDRRGPPETALVPCLDGDRAAAGYRVAAELVPEPAATAAELVQLVPAAASAAGWPGGPSAAGLRAP